jgi:hypothetical protein
MVIRGHHYFSKQKDGKMCDRISLFDTHNFYCMNTMENETWLVHWRGGGNIGYNLDGKIRRLSKITHQIFYMTGVLLCSVNQRISTK